MPFLFRLPLSCLSPRYLSLGETWCVLKSSRHIGSLHSLRPANRDWLLLPSCYSQICRYSTLVDRGIVSDLFPERPDLLSRLVQSATCSVYAGFDPTADSLHLGHLLVLVALLHFQRVGVAPLVVLGGATAQLGDPSGRLRERPALKLETVQKNLSGLENNVKRVFSNHERHIWTGSGTLPPLVVLNNNEWYGQYSLIDFMTIVGRRFRMSDMLSRSSVKARLAASAESTECSDDVSTVVGGAKRNSGMNFAEFSYQVLQGYDWLYLWRKRRCAIQLGGHDQRGNMLTGYELITGTLAADDPGQEAVDRQVFGVSVPLITSEEGDKLGKSAGNAIWLSSERTSAFDLYQYLMRTRDAEVHQLLRMLTFVPLAEIAQLEREAPQLRHNRRAQRLLAEQVTLLVHGSEGLASAERLSHALYSEYATEALQQLSTHELVSLMRHSPPVSLALSPDLTVSDVALAAGCFARPADAQRIIRSGGFHINQQKVTEPDLLIQSEMHVLPSGLTLLRVGKKTYYVVKWS